MAFSETNILTLSMEMHVEIFKYLDMKSLCAISSTCKEFNNIARSQKRLWRKVDVNIRRRWWSSHGNDNSYNM